MPNIDQDFEGSVTHELHWTFTELQQACSGKQARLGGGRWGRLKLEDTRCVNTRAVDRGS